MSHCKDANKFITFQSRHMLKSMTNIHDVKLDVSSLGWQPEIEDFDEAESKYDQ